MASIQRILRGGLSPLVSVAATIAATAGPWLMLATRVWLGQAFLAHQIAMLMAGQSVTATLSRGWWSDIVQEHFSGWDEALPLVTRLGLPHSCGPWPIQRLSTGERQRLGLVRALMLRSRVLLLDEPTSALDSTSAAAVESLIAERASNGTSVVWSTHDDAQARRVGSRVLVMNAEGGIEEKRS